MSNRIGNQLFIYIHDIGLTKSHDVFMYIKYCTTISRARKLMHLHIDLAKYLLNDIEIYFKVPRLICEVIYCIFRGFLRIWRIYAYFYFIGHIIHDFDIQYSYFYKYIDMHFFYGNTIKEQHLTEKKT